uniref:Uncharacterized protein n=1 Tax=Anguilla anguilla TaxID=7936 RepID=A0A0E9U3E4_ANGAN
MVDLQEQGWAAPNQGITSFQVVCIATHKQ